MKLNILYIRKKAELEDELKELMEIKFTLEELNKILAHLEFALTNAYRITNYLNEKIEKFQEELSQVTKHLYSDKEADSVVTKGEIYEENEE